jgi:hypothetical protein
MLVMLMPGRSRLVSEIGVYLTVTSAGALFNALGHFRVRGSAQASAALVPIC